MMTAARQASYQWRLREVMAAHGLFNATDLEPLLAERGINLSRCRYGGWSPAPRNGPCRSWPPCATSSRSPPIS